MRTLFLCAAVLALVGCDRGVVGDSTLFGDYTLRTVNGQPLPHAANGIEYLDDVISLTEAGTYSESGHWRVAVNGQTVTQPISEVGSYVFLGTSVTLTSADGKRIRITQVADSEKMTITEAGVTLVFHK
jgi:hypothetical protein